MGEKIIKGFFWQRLIVAVCKLSWEIKFSWQFSFKLKFESFEVTFNKKNQ